MTDIGFTGTRRGMTPSQKRTLRTLFSPIDPWFPSMHALVFHHGDCVGADADAHAIASKYDTPITIHPPTSAAYRAWCRGAKISCLAKSYIERNHDIVDAADILIAAPATLLEEQRSGTWATVRYARSTKTPVIILDPNGGTPA